VRIAVGSDHRGLEVKKYMVNLITEKKHTCKDFGSYSSDSADYPEIAKKVAEAVTAGNFDIGILLCGTGIGMSIAANKVKGIRAALCHDAFSASRSRKHNDANILCMSAEKDHEMMPEIMDAFFSCKFEGGRHQRRIDMITEIER